MGVLRAKPVLASGLGVVQYSKIILYFFFFFAFVAYLELFNLIDPSSFLLCFIFLLIFLKPNGDCKVVQHVW